MAGRLIHRHDIIWRRESPEDMSAPGDFVLSLQATSQSAAIAPSTLAYCADLAAERLLLTEHDPAGLPALLAAPFLFVEQLATARAVVSLPFERLAESFPERPSGAPVFVFSPGRTGSTLLARLLVAQNLACASEPDLFTQIARFSRDERRRLPAGTETTLAATCVAALCRILGPAPFIKLRSQCNARPLPIIEAAPGCRAIFLLRGVPAWAQSRHRAFQEPPEAVAHTLRQAIDALDTLAGAGIPFDIVWFETLASDPLAALRVCAPDTPISAAAIRCVMEADSQLGTPVAREIVAAQPVEPGFMAAFAPAWEAARLGAEWSQDTTAILAKMWES